MEIFKCPLCCDETFLDRNTLKDHILCTIKNIQCSVCSSHFKNVNDFTIHLGTDCQSSNDSLDIECGILGLNSTDQEKDENQGELECQVMESNGLMVPSDNKVKSVVADVEPCRDDVDVNMELFSCSYCEVSFYNVDEHIAMFHANEDVVVDGKVSETEDTLENDFEFDIGGQWVLKGNFYFFLTNSLEASEEKKLNSNSSGVTLLKEWPSDMFTYPTITFVTSAVSLKENELDCYFSMQEYSFSIYHLANLFNSCRVRVIKINGKEEGECSVDNVPFYNRPVDGSIIPLLHPVYQDSRVPKGLGACQVIMWCCSGCGLLSIIEKKFVDHCCDTQVNHCCSTCMLSFLDKEELTRHEKIHHSVKDGSDKILLKEKTNSVKDWVCLECNRVFKTEVDFEMHSTLCNKQAGTKETFECEVCGKNQFELEKLREHMVEHGVPILQYACSFCPKSFKRPTQKELHERKHTKVKPHVCMLCGHGFRIKAALSNHMRIHTGEKPYSCSVCNKAFRTNSLLRNHYSIHSPGTPFTCSFCPKQFKTKDTMRNHIYTHKRPYTCPRCSRAFDSMFKVKRHLEKHESGTLKHLCQMCPQMFSRPTYLYNHLKSEHGVDTFPTDAIDKKLFDINEGDLIKCVVCETDVELETFDSHMQKHKEDGTHLMCGGCDREFNKKEDLEFHLIICTKLGLPLSTSKCPECEEDCGSLEKLRSHMVLHGKPIRNHPCSFCYKSFPHPSQKSQHEAIHTNKKPYICRECGKRFRSQSTFVAHLRIHTGELPFTCAQCQKSFRSPSLLQCHYKTHTTGRQYKCRYCPKTFKTKDNARVHTYTHKKPFSCPICTKPFDSNFKVRQHLEMHKSGALKFKCQLCPQMFSRLAYIKNHFSFDHAASLEEKEELENDLDDDYVCCIVCKTSVKLDDYEKHLVDHNVDNEVS